MKSISLFLVIGAFGLLASLGISDAQVDYSRLVEPYSAIFDYSRPRPHDRGFSIKNVAYFDNGRDKKSVVDLRAMSESGGALTDLDNLILVAANRTGYVRFPNCKNKNGIPVQGNSFLVNDDGSDAILASGHILADVVTGDLRHGCSLEQMEEAQYIYNASYWDFRGGVRPSQDDPVFQILEVTLDNAVGAITIGAGFGIAEDFIVLRPKNGRQISQEVAPDGRIRGRFEFAPRNSTLQE